MKALLLFCLIPFSAEAYVLSQYISSPDGSSIQTFDVSSKKSFYQKESNFFDSEEDYTLGKFELKNGKVSASEIKKFEEILKKIRNVDAFLKKKDSSFNDLSSKDPHAPFFILDDFRISKDSDLYPDVKKIYENLAAKEWKHISGVKLTEDAKTVIHVKNGKETSREAFNFAFHCKKTEPPTVCAFKGLGILFVK